MASLTITVKDGTASVTGDDGVYTLTISEHFGVDRLRVERVDLPAEEAPETVTTGGDVPAPPVD